jgi:acetone carboxylase gamma subunit
VSNRVSEYLMIGTVDGQKVIQCAKCEYVFCPATENPKNHALMKELQSPIPGTLFKASKRFVFREFYCPQCATMFDAEVRLKGQPFLWDARLKV